MLSQGAGTKNLKGFRSRKVQGRKRTKVLVLAVVYDANGSGGSHLTFPDIITRASKTLESAVGKRIGDTKVDRATADEVVCVGSGSSRRAKLPTVRFNCGF
jgi:hypothetical protein